MASLVSVGYGMASDMIDISSCGLTYNTCTFNNDEMHPSLNKLFRKRTSSPNVRCPAVGSEDQVAGIRVHHKYKYRGLSSNRRGRRHPRFPATRSRAFLSREPSEPSEFPPDFASTATPALLIPFPAPFRTAPALRVVDARECAASDRPRRPRQLPRAAGNPEARPCNVVASRWPTYVCVAARVAPGAVLVRRDLVGASSDGVLVVHLARPPATSVCQKAAEEEAKAATAGQRPR